MFQVPESVCQPDAPSADVLFPEERVAINNSGALELPQEKPAELVIDFTYQ